MKMPKVIIITMLFAFGFGVNAQKRVSRHVSSESAEQTTVQGKTVHIEGMGITKTVTMNGGMLHIEGANNNISVKGFADEVYVEGANVTVQIDKVNSVKIEGANTHVYYGSTANKSGKAAVSVFGTNSCASRK